MTPLYFQVAQVAHNRDISELDESWSPVPFAQEQFFTGVTPSLQVRRIRAVLNEADNAVRHCQQVHTHHGCRPTAMTAR